MVCHFSGLRRWLELCVPVRFRRNLFPVSHVIKCGEGPVRVKARTTGSQPLEAFSGGE